jgi:arginyl-tRNA synthetase
VKTHLTQLLTAVAKIIAPEFEATILLERPKSSEHGDFATNLALVLAKPL